MELSAGIQASLAGRYASALFDLASEAGSVSQVEGDLDRLSAALTESAELRALIRNPQVSRDALRSVFDEIGETLEISGLTAGFLGTLAQNRRMDKLPEIIRAFGAIAAAQRGEVTAEVVSAHPLDDQQLQVIEGKLRAREGRTVKLRSRVDPDILGGLVVTIGSRRIDSSIRTRLNTLSQALKA
ncbi:F0F1 ATP synthase subunit delta [Croceibacterium sp. TMG7-5b_MA50]|uniref:F0F1 ATP synthase subunit delta n=1 Tax=Croceibacterium sp. TMG7-5b_MA50 TaxID=3121290 RepID=UPI003221512D